MAINFYTNKLRKKYTQHLVPVFCADLKSSQQIILFRDALIINTLRAQFVNETLVCNTVRLTEEAIAYGSTYSTILLR